MIDFFTIASGSSGNCTYVGLGGHHFLVDAGISGKRIEHALQEMKLNAGDLSGIFITHEHSDHITGAGVLARRFNIPIYATPLTWRYFLRHNAIGSTKAFSKDMIKHIEPGTSINVDNISVTAFDVSHDASQPVGYTFEIKPEGASSIKKFAIATDLGHVTETVRFHLRGSNILMLESNHDPEMLEKGRYHASLKARVASKRGHLSNAEAGMLLTEIADENLEHVFLAHLSEENNNPMIAYDTVKRILDGNNINIKKLSIAERHQPGEFIRYGS